MTAYEDFLHAFRAVVDAHPDRLAVDGGGSASLTYAALYARSSRLGERLSESGAGPEHVVGLYLDKSPEYVVALLGTWFAGAAFLPLDPCLPAERLDFLVRDSGMTLALARPGCEGRLEGLGVRALTDWPPGDGAGPPPSLPPERLAYVIYTSGSTGAPKGVLVTHAGVVNFLRAQIPAFGLRPGCRALFYLSTSFDASLSEVGTALLSGATLCVEPPQRLHAGPALLDLLRERAITHVDLPPALLAALDPAGVPACLETVVIGGEVCPPEAVRSWARRVRVVNVYGPTEATVCTSLCPCDPDVWDEPLLGTPIPNVSLHVLDEALGPVPPGTPGELFIGGVGLARGYLNRPELTAEKFIGWRGQRLYRTGDRVVRRGDGEFVFLGRVDRQVKVRGMLVEPEEVEAQLLRHPGVRHAAVVKRALTPTRDGLVAFVVPAPGALPSPRALRDQLAKALPRWMLPQRFELRAGLPRTPGGKVDLGALKACELARPGSGTPPGEPRAGEERILAGVWERVLGVGPVGPHDDFFELGGDSLAVLEVVSAARSFGLVLPPALLAGGATVAGLAAWLRRSQGGSEPDPDAMSCAELRRDVEPGPEWQALLRAARARADPLPAPGAPKAILLTGATGFLGSRVLAELLNRTHAQLFCLVRAPDPAAGLARIRAALARHGIVLPGPAGRVVALCGDLERPLLGLAEADWVRLAREVDRVYHCGARVNLVLPYAALRPPNVLGTREVARFLCAGRRKELHYASTLSVFVSTDRNRGLLKESDGLEEARIVYGGYAQTKWAAEHLLRRVAPDAGLVRFYRLGLLTGDTRTGYSPPDDLLGLFCRGVAALGCVPEGVGLHVDVTPVDYAAAALAEISLRARPAGPDTFHIANPRSLSLGELTAALRAFGLAVEAVPAPEWRRRLEQHARRHPDLAASAAHLALCRCLGGAGGFDSYRALDLFQATGVTFGTDNTDSALAGSGLACPAPTPELLHTYLAYIFQSLNHRVTEGTEEDTERKR